jgi:hypothetical protein
LTALGPTERALSGDARAAASEFISRSEWIKVDAFAAGSAYDSAPYPKRKVRGEDQKMADTYKGSCFCGDIEVEVTGAPAAMGYCHCEDCKSWSASPINAFSLWPTDAVRVTKGEANIATYNKTEASFRKFCKRCGGHVMSDHPGMKLVDVYVSILRDFPYQPALHVHYGNKMVSVKDGLPKFKDMPAEFGGSGETLPE